MYKIISIILLSSLLFYSNCFAKDKAVKNKPVEVQPKVEKKVEMNVVTVKNTAEFRQALENAAVNGKDDTIILEAGTYKTTADSQGTFKFADTEAHSLTIKAKDGLTATDVILDGANTHQVLNLTNTETATFTLDRVTIRNGKSSGGGGGIYSINSLIVTNSTISGNTSSGGGGGGIHGSTVTVTNTTISGNTASYSGGGIHGSTVTITNSTISGNTAYSGGGIGGKAAYSAGNTVTVTNSTISGNTASSGGGISGSTVTVTNSTISGNTASYSGGGIDGNLEFTGSGIEVTNSTISGNTASSGGGIYGSTVTVTNSTISGNTAFSGGGIYGSTVTVTNSTISGNTNAKNTHSLFGISDNSGGGIYGYGTFVNNIFNNNSSDIYFRGKSNVYNNCIDYTKLQNEASNTIVKKNNIQPSSGSLNFADSNFRLGTGSVAIDKGLDPNSTTFKNLFTNANTLRTVMNALQTDKAGNKRFIGSEIDLGPYEFDPATYKPPVEKKPIASFETKEKSSNQNIKDNVNISSNQIGMSEKLTAFNEQKIKAEINRGNSVIQNCLDEKMTKKSFKLNTLSEYTKCADEAIKENESKDTINDAFLLGIYFRVWGNLVIADKHSVWDNPKNANEYITALLKNIRKKQQQFKLTDKSLCGILDIKYEKLRAFFESWSLKSEDIIL